MPIWHIIGRTCFGLRAFERGRLRKIPGLPTVRSFVPNPTQPNPTQHCKPMQRMWRHHGHDSAVQLGGRPSLHHPSSHHRACGNRLSRLEVKGLVTIAQSAHTCPPSPDCVWMRHLHEPAASRDPDRAGDSSARVSRLPSLKNTLSAPAFTSSTRPQPPAHHVEVIALKSNQIASWRRPPPR